MLNVLGIKLYGYGLMIGLAVLAAWEVSLRFGKVSKEKINSMALGVILSGIIGARAYHVIDLWEYYSENVSQVFALWNGGLGIWGAILGGGLYTIYHCKREKLDALKVLDSLVLGLPLAQAVGRVGNFINKELYGKNGEPLFAWEGGLNLVLFSLLIYLSRKETKNGLLSGIYFVGYGVIRILLENFRPDNIIWRMGQTPTATIFGILSIALGLFFIALTPKRNLK